MWWENPEDIHEYFSRIEEGDNVPEEEILGEEYFVISQNIWSEWLEEFENDGLDTYGLDTADQRGAARSVKA